MQAIGNSKILESTSFSSQINEANDKCRKFPGKGGKC
jgi:hypothetical protein